MSAYGIFAKDVDGSSFIPASQRPDGTWRKQRRVRDGYIPQDEVPLYESKGKQIVKNKPQYPVGYTPDVKVNNSTPSPTIPVTKRCPIPGLVVDETFIKKTKNKKAINKSTSAEKIIDKISKVSLQDTTQHNNAQDPSKKLKNLKKKLREIEMIENKIKSGELKAPEKEQLQKIQRKNEISKEIKELESRI